MRALPAGGSEAVPSIGRPADPVLRLLAVSLLVLAALPVRGEPRPGTSDLTQTQKLTLEQAVILALENHPSLEVERARERVARAELEEAEASRRPGITLGATGSLYDEPMVVTPIHGFTPGEAPQFDDTLIRADLAVGHDLWEGGGRRSRIDRERHRTSAAEETVEARKQALVSTTAAAYLRVLGVHDVLKAHEQRLRALEAERDRVEALLEVGRAAEVDRRRVEATLAAAEAERATLAADLDEAERDLGRLLSLDPARVRAPRLEGELELAAGAPSRDDLVRILREASPEIASARRELAAAEAAVALARSTGRPDLRVEGHYQEFGSSGGRATGEWYAALQLAIPLYQGGAVEARVGRAEAARDAAVAAVRLAEDRILGALDRALADLRRAGARGRSLEVAAERFATVAEVEKLRLESGVGIQADYLAAEADLLAARARRIEARFAEMTARIELERTAGRLNAERLRQILEEDR